MSLLNLFYWHDFFFKFGTSCTKKLKMGTYSGSQIFSSKNVCKIYISIMSYTVYSHMILTELNYISLCVREDPRVFRMTWTSNKNNTTGYASLQMLSKETNLSKDAWNLLLMVVNMPGNHYKFLVMMNILYYRLKGTLNGSHPEQKQVEKLM